MNKKGKFGKRKTWILIFIILVSFGYHFSIFLSNPLIGNNIEEMNKKVPTVSSGMIEIDGNAELESFCTKGNGTFANPYVIEGNTYNSYDDRMFYITNTGAFLIIRGCTFNGYSSLDTRSIYLYNCTNINISNNDFFDNQRGISLLLSSNISMTNNSFTSSNPILSMGISIWQSHHNSIMNNCLSGLYSGIRLSLSNNNTLFGNIINFSELYSISLSESSNNTFKYNLMNNGGFSFNDNSSYNNLVDISNKIYGKSVRYYESESSGMVIGEEDIGQLIIINCTGFVIQNVNISNNYKDITLYDSNNNSFLDIKLNSDSFKRYGIDLHNSNNNTFSNVKIHGGAGIQIIFSDKNIFVGTELDECGFSILGLYNNSIDMSNKINGKSVHYLKHEKNIAFSDNEDVGQLILYNCSNIIVENLNISNTYKAIEVFDSHQILIQNNVLTNNIFGIGVYQTPHFPEILTSYNNTIQGNILKENNNGIMIIRGKNHTITSNLITNGEGGIFISNLHNSSFSKNNINFHTVAGMYMSYSNNNTFFNNSVFSNTLYGLFLDISINNTFWNNIFAGEHEKPVYLGNDSENNMWYLNETGNYWGDYEEQYPDATNDGRVWDTPYEVMNGTGIYDMYPLYIPEESSPEGEDDNKTGDGGILGFRSLGIFGILGLVGLVIRHKNMKNMN